MSKGLEAIRQYKQVTCQHCQYHYGGECNNEDECFSTIIEKELKEYQQHEEILNDYGLTLANFREACLLLAMLKHEKRNIRDIDKQLKALEIIRNKRVDVDYFIYACVVDDWSYEDYLEEYNSTSSWFICGQRSFGYQGKEQPLLTREEYYLLKEVLL